MEGEQRFPELRQVVLDTTDARRLTEFYRRMLGFRYRPGDDAPAPGGDHWFLALSGYIGSPAGCHRG